VERERERENITANSKCYHQQPNSLIMAVNKVLALQNPVEVRLVTILS
jgi:hypothetical protein